VTEFIRGKYLDLIPSERIGGVHFVNMTDTEEVAALLKSIKLEAPKIVVAE